MKKTLKVRFELAIAKLLYFVFSRLKLKVEYPLGLNFKTFTFGAFEKKNEIPKKIWAYWDTGSMPLSIQCCLDSWAQYCKGYEVIIVNNENIGNYINFIPDEVWALTVQKRSDWMRLELLNAHGGIWLDAGIVLTRSLDWVIDEQKRTQADFVGFYLDNFTTHKHYPVVESWFMAAPIGSAFIQKARDEFLNEIVLKDSKAYIQQLVDKGIYGDLRQNIDSPEYLIIHVAMQKVIQSADANFKLVLLRAEDSAFLWQEKAHWNRDLFKFNIFFRRVSGDVTPLLKLRGPDRRRLDFYLQDHLYVDNSFADQYFSKK